MNFSPVIQITLAYIAGIIIAKAVNIPFPAAILTFLFAFGMAGSLVFRQKSPAIALLILFLLLGTLNYQLHNFPSAQNANAQFSHGQKVKSRNPLICFSLSVRDRLQLIPQKSLPPYYANLLNSFVLGSQAAELPSDTKEAYRSAGVAHLLVVSGMQVALLVGVCLQVLKNLGIRKTTCVLMVSVINLLLVLMTGAGASILRAALMAEIMLIGMLFGREEEFYSSMFLSLFIILLFNPSALFDIGLQLSYAASWSLFYAAPVVSEKLGLFLPQAFASLIAMAFSPCLATLPLTIYYFGQFSCVGILTNILLLPWISCIVVLGFIAYLVGVVFLPLADVINGANLILLAISDKIVSFLAELPFAQIFIAAPKIPIVIGYYLCLAGGVEVIRRGRIPRFTRFRSFLLVLLLLTCLAWNSALSDISSLVITVLNVGQGEAIYIESPAGKKILLDGGTAERASKVVLPFLARKGVNQLDFVLFSHLHDDHAAGLYTVLRRIPCRKILDQTKVRAREEIDFGGGAKGVVLYAHSNLIPRAAEENANRSLAFKLIYHNFSMLFTGDNAAEDEAAMLQALPVSRFSSAVLKVGHHGSRLSTTDNFLDKVHPRVAVISCGRHNRFYHPHATTLNKLVTRGIKVYRTDRQGTITIRTNGEQFAVACEKLE